MNIVRDPALLNYYLKKYKIEERFDTPDLHFRLRHYRKGEQILHLQENLEYFLFLVEGTTHVYGLRESGELAPVALHKPFVMYGEVEFVSEIGSVLYIEAQTDVYCVDLSMTMYRNQLKKDIKFLNTMLSYLGNRMVFYLTFQTSGEDIEERVLYYLENYQPDHCIHSVKNAMTQLSCSRRQLQRVLKKLCDEGKLVKLKKGTYQLVM